MTPFKPLATTLALATIGIGVAAAALATAATPPPVERPHHVYLIGSLRVTQPWIDVDSASTGEAAAYLIVENRSASPDRLTGASFDGAASVSLEPDGGGFVVPPMGTLTLKRDDAHLELHGLHGVMPKGPAVDATLRFERSGALKVAFLTDRTDAVDDDQTSPSTDQPVDLTK